jgi:hypothetical protein
MWGFDVLRGLLKIRKPKKPKVNSVRMSQRADTSKFGICEYLWQLKPLEDKTVKHPRTGEDPPYIGLYSQVRLANAIVDAIKTYANCNMKCMFDVNAPEMLDVEYENWLCEREMKNEPKSALTFMMYNIEYIEWQLGHKHVRKFTMRSDGGVSFEYDHEDDMCEVQVSNKVSNNENLVVMEIIPLKYIRCEWCDHKQQLYETYETVVVT